MKASIYDVDLLPGGEVELEMYLSRKGYTIEKSMDGERMVCAGRMVVGKIIDGTYFSSNRALELHCFNNTLERLVEELSNA